MKHLSQWINWRLLPPEPPETKWRKVPHDLASGQKIDPHNPAGWLSYEEATRRDPEHVGFVLTDNDPYWFVDLDHCHDGHDWTAHAKAVAALFPCSYLEISHSPNELHTQD